MKHTGSINRAATTKLPSHVQKKDFPKQGEWLGKLVNVKFFGDRKTMVLGIVIREDVEPPGLTLIRLHDGRVVTGTEVRYVPKDLYLTPFVRADNAPDALAAPDPHRFRRLRGGVRPLRRRASGPRAA